jgi:hypothetical protein
MVKATDRFTFEVNSPNFDQIRQKFQSRRIFKDVGAEFTSTYRKLEDKLQRDMTLLFYDALRSTVPIHYKAGGTLRNQHIQVDPKLGEVWIDSATHEPPYAHTNRPTAVGLAELLESGQFNRTRPSEPEPGFFGVLGNTSFIERAIEQYNLVFSKFLTTELEYIAYVTSIIPINNLGAFPVSKGERNVIDPGRRIGTAKAVRTKFIKSTTSAAPSPLFRNKATTIPRALYAEEYEKTMIPELYKMMGAKKSLGQTLPGLFKVRLTDPETGGPLKVQVRTLRDRLDLDY